MTTGRLATWFTLAVLAMSGSQARAALVAYDSFAGTPGTSLINAGNGGTGFSSSWMPGGFNASIFTNFTNASGSLASGNLLTAGGRGTTVAQTAISGVQRTLAAPLGAAGTTAYLSILLRPEGTVGGGTLGGFFGLVLNASTTTAVSQDLFLGKPGIDDRYDLENRGGDLRHYSDTTAVSGVSTLLVLRADFTAGVDTFTLFVNPTPGGVEPLSGTIKQDSDVGLINSLVLYSTGSFSVDELRIGTTYADVVPVAVPEPASVVMLGLGGLGLLLASARRKRRLPGAVPA